jgi:UDP-GlcNAc:undecaprenyl-phosphate GlcNAc-1-phosphate transferase
LRFPSNSDTITWMIPLLVLAVPIFDTTLVFISRLRRGKNPLTTPGKDHISHRLAYLTGSRREAVLICYLIGGASGLAAVFVSDATLLEAAVLGGAVFGVALAAIWWLEFRKGGVRVPPPPAAPAPASSSPAATTATPASPAQS